MQKVLALVGPTAVGKSALAVRLAKKLNAEIISGDSMQIYREVSIGTAKPTAQQRRLVRHYLINERSIFETYSVKDFVEQAQACVSKIAKKGKLPFLVGGTGFYVNGLLNRMKLGEGGKNYRSVAPEWQNLLDRQGPRAVWQNLNNKDPVAAKKIPYQNTRRLLRALTVISRTGKSFSKQQARIPPRYDYKIIGLTSDRKLIYDRINKRVDHMMAQGLLKEARMVYQNRSREHQILQAIGYKEFFPYFSGQESLDACVREVKKASRHYAKRQLTYFRHQMKVEWFDPFNDEDVLDKIIKAVKEWFYE